MTSSDYYDVKIKKINDYKYKISIDWLDKGWNNKDYIGKIVYAKHTGEWWFIPSMSELLGPKELRIIADKIDELNEQEA